MDRPDDTRTAVELEPMQPDTPPLLGKLLEIAGRHAGLIAVCVLAGGVTGAWISRTIPAQTEAEARLFVGFDRSYVYRDEVSGAEPWIPFRLDTVMNGELEILRSRDVRDAVVDRVGVMRLAPPDDAVGVLDRIGGVAASLLGRPDEPAVPVDPRDRVLDDMAKDLRITRPLDSPVIHLAYRHTDGPVATDVLSTAIDSYLTQRTALHADTGRLAFLEAEADTARERVATAEHALAELRRETRIYAREARGEMIAARLRALQDAADGVAVEIADLTATLEGLGTPSGPSLLLDLSLAARTALQRRRELDFERARLLADFDADARPVAAIERDIAAIDAHLADLLAANIVQLTERRAGYRARLVTLEARIAGFEDDLVRQRVDEDAVAMLELDVELARRNYAELVDQRDAARRAAALDRTRMSNVRILQPPVLAPLPEVASPALYGVLGGGFGLVAGGVLAIALTMAPVGRRRSARKNPTEEAQA